MKAINFLLTALITCFGCNFVESCNENKVVAAPSHQISLFINEIEGTQMPVLRLSDGSKWTVVSKTGLLDKLYGIINHPRDVLFWSLGDVIEMEIDVSEMEPNLLIKNVTKGQRAYVNYSHAPSKDYPNYLTVLATDNNLIQLSNGTVWTKSSCVDSLVWGENWKEGDPISVLKNYRWVGHSSYLLWNHHTQERGYAERAE